jgi:hypothetical protein
MHTQAHTAVHSHNECIISSREYGCLHCWYLTLTNSRHQSNASSTKISRGRSMDGLLESIAINGLGQPGPPGRFGIQFWPKLPSFPVGPLILFFLSTTLDFFCFQFNPIIFCLCHAKERARPHTHTSTSMSRFSCPFGYTLSTSVPACFSGSLLIACLPT